MTNIIVLSCLLVTNRTFNTHIKEYIYAPGSTNLVIGYKSDEIYQVKYLVEIGYKDETNKISLHTFPVHMFYYTNFTK